MDACPVCGSALVHIHKGKRIYCSNACRQAASLARAKLDGRAEQWKAATAARKIAKRTRTLVCPQCGETFATTHGRRRYCSKPCTNRAFRDRRRSTPEGRAYLDDKKRERRARLRGATTSRVVSIEVFERDNWICQLCHVPLDRTAPPRTHFSATVDHIVPLALGGPHDMSNVQAAHFICNSVKGARVAETAKEVGNARTGTEGPKRAGAA